MRNPIMLIIGMTSSFVVGFFLQSFSVEKSIEKNESNQAIKNQVRTQKENIKLGAFSVSLNVKDLKTAKEFYENLGFKVFGGGMDKNYLIMKNDNALIGLFQGMFQGNILTFNPGWDENAKNIKKFDDVREIQKHLKSQKIQLSVEIDENTTGPASLMLTDPDGNVILFDQHR